MIIRLNFCLKTEITPWRYFPTKSIFVEKTFFVIIRFKVLLMLSGNDIDGFGY